MVQTLALDTRPYATKLKEVGVPAKQADVQARAWVELVEERLASQQDILDLRRDMKEVETRITMRLGALMMAAGGTVAALVIFL